MWSDAQTIITHIESAFQSVESGTTKLPQGVFDIQAMNGRKTRMFYNALCDISGEEIRILETGARFGASTASLAYDNSGVILTEVGSWSDFGATFNIFIQNIQPYVDMTKMTTVFGELPNVNLSEVPPVTVFVIDSVTTSRDIPSVASLINTPYAVFVIDDWNWEGVRNDTREGLASAGLSVVYEKNIFTDFDTEGAATYWNGMGVFVVSKSI